MKTVPICIGGEFTTLSQTFEVVNPFGKTLIAICSLAGKAEFNQAVQMAQQAETPMREMPAHQKSHILTSIANRLTQKRDKLAQTLAQEAAKPLKLAIGEVERAIQVFRVAAEECKRLPAEYISLDWTPAGEGKEGLVKYFPVGIVAGISPFNFPLNLTAHKIAPAIAAGCPIIVKPSRSTPLSALALTEIVYDSGLPKGALSMLPMDRESGNLMVTDCRIKLLSFTGSPQVGWQMKGDAGKKKVILELGGNAGVIVTPSANVANAVSKCVSGAFSYSGQVCIHTQRIYVHNKIFEEFIQLFVTKTQSLKVGNPTDSQTDISSLIDDENTQRIARWVEEAVDDGAKIITGGNMVNGVFLPTALTNTKNTMRVCSNEVFGPVVIIESYEDFSKAIDEVNASPFGLQAGIFTNSITEENEAFNRLEVGGVIINDTPTFRVDHMPYGGIKDSGLGREGVKYAVLSMMEPKLLVRGSPEK